MDQFDAYGLEGANLSQTWGGKFFGYAIHAMFEMRKIFSLGIQTQQSTILDAAGRGMDSYILEILKRRLDLKSLAAMSPEELAKQRVAVPGKMLRGEEILKYIRTLEAKAESEPHVFPLEEGHTPGVGENIISVAFPATVTWGLVHVGKEVFTVIRGTAKGRDYGALLGIGSGLVTGMVMVGLTSYFPDGPLMKVITFPLRPLLGGRNLSMASNIVRAFNDHPDLRTMLIIVGRAHVEGLTELLQKNYSFQQISADQLGQLNMPAQARGQ